MMKPLIVIPARGGSKGIPGKNIKLLGGRPLITYTIDCARAVTTEDRIIVSTDSPEIAETVEHHTGLPVPFLRPAHLAADSSGSRGVILDAMDRAESVGIIYDAVVLLQPTSPLRLPEDVERCMYVYSLYAPALDMAVSVVEAASNPYYNCYETGPDGFLRISKGDGRITRRQDAPEVWEYNGAVYVMNPESIRSMEIGQMPRRAASVMPRERSIDLDTPLDWIVAEAIISNRG